MGSYIFLHLLNAKDDSSLLDCDVVSRPKTGVDEPSLETRGPYRTDHSHRTKRTPETGGQIITLNTTPENLRSIVQTRGLLEL